MSETLTEEHEPLSAQSIAAAEQASAEDVSADDATTGPNLSGSEADESEDTSALAKVRYRLNDYTPPAPDWDDDDVAGPAQGEGEALAVAEAALADAEADEAAAGEISLQITDGETAELDVAEQNHSDLDEDRGTDAFASTATDEALSRADASRSEPEVLNEGSGDQEQDPPAPDLVSTSPEEIRARVAEEDSDAPVVISDAEAEAASPVSARAWLDAHVPQLSISQHASTKALRSSADHYAQLAAQSGVSLDVDDLLSVLTDRRSFTRR